MDTGATEDLHMAMPFAAALGIDVVAAGPAEVRARMHWDESRCTGGGLMHGGATMALADSAGAWCAFANLPVGSVGTVTVESKTNFFRGVRGGSVEARSRPLDVGPRMIVVETDVRDDGGHLVARVTQTQTVLY